MRIHKLRLCVNFQTSLILSERRVNVQLSWIWYQTIMVATPPAGSTHRLQQTSAYKVSELPKKQLSAHGELNRGPRPKTNSQQRSFADQRDACAAIGSLPVSVSLTHSHTRRPRSLVRLRASP